MNATIFGMSRLRVITVHVPEYVLELVVELRERGLFLSRNEAMRYAILSELSGLLQLPDSCPADACHSGVQTVCLRMPAGLLSLVDGVRRHLGVSRSEFFRIAALNYIQSMRGGDSR